MMLQRTATNPLFFSDFYLAICDGKQLPAAVCLELRKQKPLSNALGGSYLLCEEHMLRTQRKRGYDGTLSRQASS